MKATRFVLAAVIAAGAVAGDRQPMPEIDLATVLAGNVLHHVPADLALRLANLRYEGVTSPVALPADISASLARALQQEKLFMAADGENWNGGCLHVKGLPSHRFVAAAINSQFAIVEFETGGIAATYHFMVFGRAEDGVTVLGAFFGGPREPGSLLKAIHNGSLFVPELSPNAKRA